MSANWSRMVVIGGRPAGGVSPVGGLASLVVTAAGLVILIPLVLIGVVLAAVLGIGLLGYLGIKRWLFAQRQPNGVLDGRKNVRVRLPADEESVD